MLSLRKRGGVWYVRGVVQIGKEKRVVAEHSARTTERAIAEAYARKVQRGIEIGILHGVDVTQREVSFADAALVYLRNHGHVSDESRVATLTKEFGKSFLKDITADDFARFCRERLPGRAGATWERHANCLRGIFAAGGLRSPKLPRSKPAKAKAVWLPIEMADRLVDAYPDHVRPIALMARYTGMRAQEVLQLKRRHVDLARKVVIVRGPKNGSDRVVPLHPRVLAAIDPLCEGKAGDAHVFINKLGYAWTDTRHKGGNPLRWAHERACAAVGVVDFRWHDWRHHWATWALRPSESGGAGLSLRDLMEFGGWKDISQVQRYAAVAPDAADRLARME